MIVVTLICLYAACWGPTKRQGVHAVQVYSSGLQGVPVQESGLDVPPVCILPLLVVNEEFRSESPYDQIRRCYYFWFFGYVTKLPYERVTHVYQ